MCTCECIYVYVSEHVLLCMVFAYHRAQAFTSQTLVKSTRSFQGRHTQHCFMYGIIVERMYCLVHGLHDLHGIWCVFQVGTLGNTLSGCITQYLRVGARLVLSTLPTLFAWLHSCSVFTAVWCGKLTFYLHQTPSWLWLVWTNSPNFTHQSMSQSAQWSK